jgi:ATP-dependent DNA helicase RecG
MLRLLQGDVGSGKTVVVTALAYYAIRMGLGQVVLLAPLAILAQQHVIGLTKMLAPLGVRVGLLAGSLTAAQKYDTKAKISS